MAATSNELLLVTEAGVSCCSLSSLHQTSAKQGPRSLAEPAESPPSPWRSITFPAAVQIIKIAAGEAHRQAMPVWAAATLSNRADASQEAWRHLLDCDDHERW